MKNLYHHSKKEFQVERMVLFSDAVFAIAITLLIIEIKVPEPDGHSLTEREFTHVLVQLLPKFMGFIYSFFIIGIYWFIHHRMFGYVISYTPRLIWLNLVYLFSVVLMPFSTAVYSEYASPQYIRLITPYLVYVLNICFTGVMNFFMWRYIGNPKNAVTENFPGGDFLKVAKIRSLMLPLIFVFSLLFAIFIDEIFARFLLFLTPFIMRMVKNKKEE